MKEITIDLRKLPADVGIILMDKSDRTPKRFYNRFEIEKVWNCILEKIEGKTNVSLTVIGFMPLIMPAILTAHCIDAGVQAFFICKPGGLVEEVYDWRNQK